MALLPGLSDRRLLLTAVEANLQTALKNAEAKGLVATAERNIVVAQDTGRMFYVNKKLPDGTFELKRITDSEALTGYQRHQNGVLNGGEWVSRPLTEAGRAVANYDIEYAAGSGVILGQPVSWSAGKIICQNGENLIFVDLNGNVSSRVLEAPAPLPPLDQIPLMRAYAEEKTYGPGIYSVLDVRTLLGERPEANLRLKERLLEARVTEGPWAGAVRVNKLGYINWYFANLGLLGFVEELPEVVEAHLSVQVRAFYHPQTGTGEADWQALHGTAWNNYYAWAYDVEADADGTFKVGKKRRADSHDSYGSTFAFLAVAYARSGAAGEAWFAANIEPIKRAIYYNHLTRLNPIPNAAAPVGYWTSTFQGKGIWDVSYTMDNVEVWAALHAVALYLEEKGLEPDFLKSAKDAAQNVLSGLQGAWDEADGGKLRYMVWLDSGTWEPNSLTHWYPDLTVHPVVALWQPPLHADTDISRRRLDAAMAQMSRVPSYWKTRDYDAFPWAYATAAAVRAGNHTLGRENLSFLARHFWHDVEGTLLVNEMGFLRLIQKWLADKVTAVDVALGGGALAPTAPGTVTATYPAQELEVTAVEMALTVPGGANHALVTVLSGVVKAGLGSTASAPAYGTGSRIEVSGAELSALRLYSSGTAYVRVEYWSQK